jgi:hypothetical protein
VSRLRFYMITCPAPQADRGCQFEEVPNTLGYLYLPFWNADLVAAGFPRGGGGGGGVWRVINIKNIIRWLCTSLDDYSCCLMIMQVRWLRVCPFHVFRSMILYAVIPYDVRWFCMLSFRSMIQYAVIPYDVRWFCMLSFRMTFDDSVCCHSVWRSMILYAVIPFDDFVCCHSVWRSMILYAVIPYDVRWFCAFKKTSLRFWLRLSLALIIVYQNTMRLGYLRLYYGTLSYPKVGGPGHVHPENFWIYTLWNAISRTLGRDFTEFWWSKNDIVTYQRPWPMFLLYRLRLGAPIWPIEVGGPRVLPVWAHSSYATDLRVP